MVCYIYVIYMISVYCVYLTNNLKTNSWSLFLSSEQVEVERIFSLVYFVNLYIYTCLSNLCCRSRISGLNFLPETCFLNLFENWFY